MLVIYNSKDHRRSKKHFPQQQREQIPEKIASVPPQGDVFYKYNI